MATKIQLRRIKSQNPDMTIVPADGEPVYDSRNNTLLVGDGSTPLSGITPIGGGSGDVTITMNGQQTNSPTFYAPVSTPSWEVVERNRPILSANSSGIPGWSQASMFYVGFAGSAEKDGNNNVISSTYAKKGTDVPSTAPSSSNSVVVTDSNGNPQWTSSVPMSDQLSDTGWEYLNGSVSNSQYVFSSNDLCTQGMYLYVIKFKTSPSGSANDNSIWSGLVTVNSDATSSNGVIVRLPDFCHYSYGSGYLSLVLGYNSYISSSGTLPSNIEVYRKALCRGPQW